MKLPSITFTQDALARFDEVIQKEWLITNGLGGYASSTVLGINTRKYHGLLVAALHPPGDRTVCLSKLDEDILVGNEVFRLGANEFHGAIYPQGYKFIKQFSIAPFPTYMYQANGVAVSKTVFMPKNKNAVAAIYSVINRNNSDASIRIYPLLTCRHFHNVVNRWANPLDVIQKQSAKEVETTFHEPEASIICRITDGEFKEKINSVEQLHYREETRRGEADADDCFQPGYFEIKAPAAKLQTEFAVTAAAGPETHQTRETLDVLGINIDDVKESLNRELEQRRELLVNFYNFNNKVPMSDWLNWILLAADSFIVQNDSNKKSVIAGYFWFEPWGRDTFILMPGLMLVLGRFKEAREIMLDFAQFCEFGLIPNFITDKSGEPVYNTVDGTLWFVNAVYQYVKYTCDFKFVQDKLWEKLQAVINYHERGTAFGIRMDSDGLLMHGSGLTWMDARVDGNEITPRAGKAVEIQALWYNALKIMEILANKFEEASLAEKYAAMADKASESFNEKYWNPKLNCLYDVLEKSGVDASIRPNQIFAVSLDFSMLDKEKSERVVDLVHRELATPYGLRTLATDDPKFQGKCIGDRRSRDTAYHNGTIWPWLLGPFITAYLKVNEYTDFSRDYALKNFVLPLFSVSIHDTGLGTISEIFDGDYPNIPRGCIAQAWSVAEPLRAYVEDVLKVRPKFEKAVKLTWSLL